MYKLLFNKPIKFLYCNYSVNLVKSSKDLYFNKAMNYYLILLKL